MSHARGIDAYVNAGAALGIALSIPGLRWAERFPFFPQLPQPRPGVFGCALHGRFAEGNPYFAMFTMNISRLSDPELPLSSCFSPYKYSKPVNTLA